MEREANITTKDQHDIIPPTTTETEKPKDDSILCFAATAESAISRTAESALSLRNVLAPLNYVRKLVWRGGIAMHGLRSFTAKAFAVSGRTDSLSRVSGDGRHTLH